MKRLIFKPIDEVTALLWKNDTLNYLKGMEEVPEEMQGDLMKMLRPNYKYKGHMLLDPDMMHTHAHYLRSGLVKLYVIDVKSAKELILHIWLSDEIIVLYSLFRKRLANEKYYIKLIENGELVSISNDSMDIIYKAYPAADRLTIDILEGKSERRIKQLEVLGIECKGDRYEKFVELFPELVNRLGNEDVCAFLGISEPTLIRSRNDYLNAKV